MGTSVYLSKLVVREVRIWLALAKGTGSAKVMERMTCVGSGQAGPCCILSEKWAVNNESPSGPPFLDD